MFDFMEKNCIICNIMSEFTKIVGNEDGSLGTIDIYYPRAMYVLPKNNRKVKRLRRIQKNSK